MNDVIYTDLLDGLETSIDLTDNEARQLAPTDVVGQTLIFVIILLLLGALFFNAYRPFTAKVMKEVRRATIVLAGLPDYVDIAQLTK